MNNEASQLSIELEHQAWRRALNDGPNFASSSSINLEEFGVDASDVRGRLAFGVSRSAVSDPSAVAYVRLIIVKEAQRMVFTHSVLAEPSSPDCRSTRCVCVSEELGTQDEATQKSEIYFRVHTNLTLKTKNTNS